MCVLCVINPWMEHRLLRCQLIYRYTLLVLAVSIYLCIQQASKRQNRTDLFQVLCETSRYPREGLQMIRIRKSCLQKI